MPENHQNITIDILLSNYTGPIICIAAFLLVLILFLFLRFRK